MSLMDDARRTVAAEKSSQEIEFEKLSGTSVRSVRWLVPGRIPRGRITLWAGDGGKGKSTAARSLIASVSTGRPAFGLNYTPEGPGKIIVMASEDSFEECVVPHLIAEGADLDKIAKVYHVRAEPDGRKFRMHLGLEHIVELRAALKERRDIELLVIDPAASFAGRMRIDANREAEVRAVVDPLAELADATGVAVLLIAHLNKAGDAKAVHRIAGSAAWVNAVRMASLVAADPDDDDRRLLMPVKSNVLGSIKEAAAFRLVPIAEGQQFRRHPSMLALTDAEFATVTAQMATVRFEADVSANADDVMGAKRKDPNKVARCCEWLKEFLHDFAYPSQEISDAAKEAGFTIDNVFKAKTALKAEGLRNKKYGADCWWSGFGDSETWQSRPASLTSRVPRHSRDRSQGTQGSHVSNGTLESLEREEREYAEVPP